jgi:phosphatidylserine decarboxylase
MLDSLGSTLSRQTVDSFYTRYGRRPQEDSITIPEAVRCLEVEICRPTSERKKVDLNHDDDTTPNTPSGLGGIGMLSLDKLDFSGPGLHIPPNDEPVNELRAPRTYPTESFQLPLEEVASSGDRSDHTPPPGDMMRNPSTSSEDADESGGSNPNDDSRECVINVKNCPLCHRSLLNSKAEMDIVTHLAVCASQDWNRVNKIVVGNFVTASQAQRKWYTKIISKVSNGNYRLGAVSAVSGL